MEKKSTKLIYKKIGNIMAKIGVVKKAGKIEFGSTKYDYQTVEDIVSEVRKYMVEEGVIIFPISAELVNTTVQSITEKEDGKSKAITTTIFYKYRFVAVEDGSGIEVGMIGQGTDSADKGSNKAASGAYKYVLKEVFMIESGEDDPDKVASGKYKGSPTQATKAQTDLMEDLNKRKGIDFPPRFPKISKAKAGAWISKAIQAKPVNVQKEINKMDKKAKLEKKEKSHSNE